ncbi:MAG TPA: gliding motility-associated C-terminal domain-containing protein [Bacteroidales bacterium]|nr:gliding motility-associated C-terminal domain-containing protein [Bacteroidales bacterium]
MIIIIFGVSSVLFAQDIERPLSPFLDLVTVNPATGHVTLNWSPGGSPDVAGYIIYTYLNGEGSGFDTIYNPIATMYTHTKSNADIISVSYVVAAIDSSGNRSPLSNHLGTIYLTTTIDTCRHEINLVWNKYNEEYHTVNEYIIKFSKDNGPTLIAGNSPNDDTTFTIGSFETGSEYCFVIEANIEPASISSSIMSCKETDIFRPPDWINADYTRIDENGEIEISFTYDPMSEIDQFILERSENPATDFTLIESVTNNSGSIILYDRTEREKIFYYRLAALNECSEPLVYSNIASLIITKADITDKLVSLSWNHYYKWQGDIEHYMVYRNHQGIYLEVAVVSPGDSTFSDDLYPLYPEITGDLICYYVIAGETGNPHVTDAESRSRAVCVEAPVRIFVPNAFTPDDDTVNDTFLPVMSFTPSKYNLIIKSRNGITLFESDDYLKSWSAEYRGEKLPQDVYLWFLEVKTPSGRTLTRNGTVTIIF